MQILCLWVFKTYLRFKNATVFYNLSSKNSNTFSKLFSWSPRLAFFHVVYSALPWVPHYVPDRQIMFKNCGRVKLRCFQIAFNRSDFRFSIEFEPEGLGSSIIQQNDRQMKIFDLIFLDKSISLIFQPWNVKVQTKKLLSLWKKILVV